MISVRCMTLSMIAHAVYLIQWQKEIPPQERAKDMKYLSKIPFWGWILFLSVVCYGLWNPWKVSVFHMWTEGHLSIPARCLITLSFGVVLAFFAVETKRTLGSTGVTVYLIFVGVVIWLFYDLHWLSAENSGVFKYIGPFILALLLAIGSQFNKLRRYATGRVTVEDPDTNDHGDDLHHDHED
jgi:hypothetical protein